jgi:hypothetical protein
VTLKTLGYDGSVDLLGPHLFLVWPFLVLARFCALGICGGWTRCLFSPSSRAPARSSSLVSWLRGMARGVRMRALQLNGPLVLCVLYRPMARILSLEGSVMTARCRTSVVSSCMARWSSVCSCLDRRTVSSCPPQGFWPAPVRCSLLRSGALFPAAVVVWNSTHNGSACRRVLARCRVLCPLAASARIVPLGSSSASPRVLILHVAGFWPALRPCGGRWLRLAAEFRAAWARLRTLGSSPNPTR